MGINRRIFPFPSFWSTSRSRILSVSKESSISRLLQPRSEHLHKVMYEIWKIRGMICSHLFFQITLSVRFVSFDDELLNLPIGICRIRNFLLISKIWELQIPSETYSKGLWNRFRDLCVSNPHVRSSTTTDVEPNLSKQ